jgi:hypothetical protein
MHSDQWRAGVLAAAGPLAVLVLLILAAMIALALMRNLTASLGFITQQAVAIATLALGGLIAATGYGMACRRVLARIHAWQLADRRPAAAAAMGTLCLTALFVLFPMLLATMLPQHPAP